MRKISDAFVGDEPDIDTHDQFRRAHLLAIALERVLREHTDSQTPIALASANAEHVTTYLRESTDPAVADAVILLVERIRDALPDLTKEN
jgi:hypothetical protein